MPELSYWKVLTRRKTLTNDIENDTKLNRVLGTYDLTALGVGATLGVGIYVLAGHVARDQAGPSVILSFLIAAIASLLAGLCYAEFGARVPKAGSAYIYSYVCIGEFVAFIIGWNLILEYIIGSASVCRGISLYLDTLINDTLKITFTEIAPIEWGFLANYFDLLAFALASVFGVSLAFGIQVSTVLNNFCTILNIGVVIFVIIAGAIKADINNWQIDVTQVNTTNIDKPLKLGSGGFFPFGFEGTIRGAATCFFGFVGFDCIATTGEEVQDPRRAIPKAILYSLLIIFLSYFGVSTVLTLMWPYYLQDVDAPLPHAFKEIGWPVAKWIVTIGGMIGLIASLFGAMFPLPRIIYAMSQDGLVFQFLGKINSRFKTPVVGSICAAFLTGIFAGLFDLTQLVNMLSIGTLLAYTVVAISITILRFMDNTHLGTSKEDKLSLSESSILMNRTKNKTSYRNVMIQVFNFKKVNMPNELSTRIVCTLIMIYCLSCLAFSLTLTYAKNEIILGSAWAISLLVIFAAIGICLILAISVQPQEKKNKYFKVPLVPLLPGISIFVNIYLMLQLDLYTWIRFSIWMSIGLIVYLMCICLYDRNSNYNRNLTNSYRTYSLGLINQGFDSDLMTNNGKISMVMSHENCGEMIERPSKTPSPKSSLDEIVLASEINNLCEMKHANGNIFFIENDSPDLGKKQIIDENSNSSDSNDAKSVIAILDHVLQDEESGFRDYDRKASVDSEMLPSFVDISTAAMIHNSGEFLIKEEEENVSELSETENEEISVPVDEKESEKNKDSNVEQITEHRSEETEPIEPNQFDTESVRSVSTRNLSFVENKLNDLPDIEHNDLKSNFNSAGFQETADLMALSRRNSMIQVRSPDSPVPQIADNNPILPTKAPSAEAIASAVLRAEAEDNQPRIPPEDAKEVQTTNDPSACNPETEQSSTETGNAKLSPPPLPLPSAPTTSEEKPNITPAFKSISPVSHPALSRKSSTSSNKSAYDDAVHSENFKAKLEKIMMRPPPLIIPKKDPTSKVNKKINRSDLKTAPAEIPSSPLKLCKSEADITTLVQKAIQDVDTKDAPDVSSTTSTIPKPPKFDPILYKSLGATSFAHNRERPKLDELIGKQSEPKPDKLNSSENKTNGKVKFVDINSQENEAEKPVPFKERLAALIKRGPSYKVNRQAPTNSLDPQSSDQKEIKKNSYSDVIKSIKEAKLLSGRDDKTDPNSSSTPNFQNSLIKIKAAKDDIPLI